MGGFFPMQAGQSSTAASEGENGCWPEWPNAHPLSKSTKALAIPEDIYDIVPSFLYFVLQAEELILLQVGQKTHIPL